MLVPQVEAVISVSPCGQILLLVEDLAKVEIGNLRAD